MSDKKFHTPLIPAAGVVFFSIVLTVFIFKNFGNKTQTIQPIQKNQKALEVYVTTQDPNPVIYFDPSSLYVPQNGSATISLMMDAKANIIGFVNVEFDFLPGSLALTSEIQPGTTMKTVNQLTTMAQANATGHVVISLGLSYLDRTRTDLSTGVFKLADLKFKTLSTLTTSTPLNFTANKTSIVNTAAVRLSGTLQGGQVISQQCLPGSTTCNGNNLLTCNAQGSAYSSMACPTNQTCQNGSCVVSYSCNATDVRCYSGQPQICAADRMSYAASTNQIVCGGDHECVGNQCYIPGDTNGDNHVNGTDYARWLWAYVSQPTTSNGFPDADFNHDTKVDGVDYVIWLNHYIE